MLNIDVDYLVVRFESGLAFFNEIKKDMPVASKQEQNREFRRKMIGKVVVQKYDQKLFRVLDVDFT
jgi:signal transduction protein with GAF and PtsI domain